MDVAEQSFVFGNFVRARRFAALLLFTAGVAFALAASAQAQSTAEPGAVATLQNAARETIGEATFTDTDEGVVVRVALTGFSAATAGAHGIHIHQTGTCTPDFNAAGGHFNPTGAEHGLENPEGAHAGDLPNITIDEQGNAEYEALSNRISLGAEPGTSVLAGDGSALLIHSLADDQVTDPSGASGERIACGVITRPDGSAAEPPAGAEAEDLNAATQAPTLRSATPELIETLVVPEGFELNVFAQGLGNVRMMVQAEDGTVYATRPTQGDVIALRDDDGDGVADFMATLTQLEGVHGITIHEGRIYLATPTTVYAAELFAGGNLGQLEEVVSGLPSGGQHPARTIAFGPDGRLYISIGSTCNACDDTDPRNATIQVAEPDGSGLTAYAEGLRNTIGFGWHPQTGELWGMDHGSDWRGDDQPPEELNRLSEGADYGWPYCFGDRQPDPYLAGAPQGATKAEYCGLTEPPALTYQAHSAPIGMVFYSADGFPEEFGDDAFVAMRGSWNRTAPVGYEVVHVSFENGEPVGFETFLSGFLIEDGAAQFGRVAGLLVTQDGSLLVSEDQNGVIYKVSFVGAE